MTRRFKSYLLTALFLCSVGIIGVAAVEPPAAEKDAKITKGDPYPLDTCVVSGEKLGSMGQPVIHDAGDGREVRFCCKGCTGMFEKDKAKYLRALDEKIIAQQIKHYPLTNCVVMEVDELDSEEMEAYNHVYGNRLVRFCCKGCLPEFEKDPAKYVAKIDQAVVKQQKSSYPLETCPISGEKLGNGAVDHVVGVTLVRFCCKNCIAKFNEDPQPTMAKVHEAWKAKHTKENDDSH